MFWATLDPLSPRLQPCPEPLPRTLRHSLLICALIVRNNLQTVGAELKLNVT